MSRLKHTPGPWQLTDDGLNGTLTGLWRIYFLDEHGAMIDKKGVAVCASEANARLIAAAPDLLSACEQAVKRLKELDKYREIDSSATYGLIEKAIAKARGER